MQYSLTPFTEKNRRTKFSTNPQLRVQKGARFVLNASAHKQLREPEDVELLWDSENRVIGIRAASANARELGYAYKLRHPASSGLYSFSSRRFAEVISDGLNQPIEGTFAAEADNEMLIVKLPSRPGGESI